MTHFTHFLIAFGLSYIGSLPFGMINMMVAHTAIRKGLKFAIWAAVGASLVELLQVFVALKFTWLFTENAEVEYTFKVIASVVFFAAGVYFFFFAKTKAAVAEPELNGRRRNEFFKGMLISSLNVMVIPYWIFYGTLLTANDLLVKDNLHVLIFSIGTMFGTFSLLVCYALLGTKILRKSEQVTKWVNKFIGVLLLGFGIYQVIQLMMNYEL